MAIQRKHIAEITRFGISGVAGFAVDAGLVAILIRALGLGPIIAQVTAFTVAVTVTWLINLDPRHFEWINFDPFLLLLADVSRSVLDGNNSPWHLLTWKPHSMSLTSRCSAPFLNLKTAGSSQTDPISARSERPSTSTKILSSCPLKTSNIRHQIPGHEDCALRIELQVMEHGL
jgi:hypothetical protein